MASKNKEKTQTERPGESLELLQFGEKLYNAYSATVKQNSNNGIQIERFGDYIHHFGFSLESAGGKSTARAAVAGDRPTEETKGDLSPYARAENAGEEHLLPRGRATPFTTDLKRADEHVMENFKNKKFANVSGLLQPYFDSQVELVNKLEKENATGEEGGVILSSKDIAALLTTYNFHNEISQALNNATSGTEKGSEKLDLSTKAIFKELALHLTKPYQEVSWRQSATQCAHLMARSLYLFLVYHFCPNLLEENAAAEEDSRVLLEDQYTVFSELLEERLSVELTNASNGGAEGGKKSKKKSTVPVATTTVIPFIPDPLLVCLLKTGKATSQQLAEMYALLCEAMDLPCDVVKGFIKSRVSEEKTTWSWNVVTVQGKQYIVDVGAAMVSLDGLFVPRRMDVWKGNAAKRVDELFSESAPLYASAAGATSTTTGGKGGGGPKQKEVSKKPDVEEPPHKEPLFTLNSRPQFCSSDRRRYKDFFFYTPPEQFIYTHYTANTGNSLLVTSPTQVQWEVMPRLSVDFFCAKSSLSLPITQRKACNLTARTMPFHISILNDITPQCDNSGKESSEVTELCCVVYPGPLKDLPPTFAGREEAVYPVGKDAKETAKLVRLGPEWLYHVRKESTEEETFSLLVPEAGFYSVVIGARTVRQDPYSTRITPEGKRQETCFVPVLFYQLRVNFTAVVSPLFPRQHISPLFVQLVSPLSTSVTAGKQQVMVLSYAPNVVAVAVVSCTERLERRERGASFTSAANKSKDSTQSAGDTPVGDVRREVVGFMRFNFQSVCFETEVELKAGTSVELWVLYSAPDKNGLTLRDRLSRKGPTTVGETEPAVEAATSSGKGSKKKGGERGNAEAQDEEALRKKEVQRFETLLGCGQLFRPFVTNIFVKKFLSKDTSGFIHPVLDLAQEQPSILKRLTGFTSVLHQDTVTVSERPLQTVGAYFDVQDSKEVENQKPKKKKKVRTIVDGESGEDR